MEDPPHVVPVVADAELRLDGLDHALGRPDLRGPPVGGGAAGEEGGDPGELLRREPGRRPRGLPPPQGLPPALAELPHPDGHGGAAHPVRPGDVGGLDPRLQVPGGGEPSLLLLLPRQSYAGGREGVPSHAGG